jgi:Zn ribbon nucleic-acid-binding protein
MFLFKACPRCRRGDLIVEQEEDGRVATCLQCGYIGELRVALRALAALAEGRARPHGPQAAHG